MTVWNTIDFRHELTDMPERRLDPPDNEDMTPEQEREQRAQIVRDMPLEVMADMIADASGELAPTMVIEYIIQSKTNRNGPNEVGSQWLAKRLHEALSPRLEAYIEHQLTGRVTGER